MMSLQDLKILCEQKGFNTYQKDRTDLIMIAKGYTSTVNARPLAPKENKPSEYYNANNDAGFFKKNVDYDMMSLFLGLAMM